MQYWLCILCILLILSKSPSFCPGISVCAALQLEKFFYESNTHHYPDIRAVRFSFCSACQVGQKQTVYCSEDNEISRNATCKTNCRERRAEGCRWRYRPGS